MCCRRFLLCSPLRRNLSPFTYRNDQTSSPPRRHVGGSFSYLQGASLLVEAADSGGAGLSLPRLPEHLRLRMVSACRSKSPEAVACVHSPIVKLGLQDHAFLNNSLLMLYSKSYGLLCARYLFDELLHRDVATWTTMMSAYAKAGEHEEALRVFRDMLLVGCSPNECTLSIAVRVCSIFGVWNLGVSAHAHILKLGLGYSPVLDSVLMEFYSNFGELDDALKIFAMMDDDSSGDTISWTTMISAMVKEGDIRAVLKLYQGMLARGVSPSEYTFANLVVACGACSALLCGKLVHAHLIIWGVELNLVLKTALVDMYLRCHEMGDAVKSLHQTPEYDVMLWTAVISGYNQVSAAEEAISTFREMKGFGIKPNAFTYAGILKTCSSISALELGQQIHSQVVKACLEDDVSVGNSLMDMYTKCSSNVNQIRLVFNRIASPNVVSWTTLIIALGLHHCHQAASSALLEMQAAGFQPNFITLSSILKGCGPDIEALKDVGKLHAYTLKMNFASVDETIENSLIGAYARLGEANEAWKIFSRMRCRDVITYTSLAKGMNQMGLHDKALELINYLHADNVKMDSFSMSCFLSASAGLAAMEPGKQLHCYSIKSCLDSSISVSNGLIDMYGKCGSMAEARFVFMMMQDPNVVSWNGLIYGLASNGHFSDALSAFEDMRMADIQPDDITSLLVLYACSHAGLVDLGLEYFNSMKELYGITPKPDHYVCLVDLLGRSGRLDEALQTINSMPFRPDALIYKTLLGSCKLHNNLSLAEIMARFAFELDPSDPAIYVMLSNIYEDCGKSDYAKRIRIMMKERGLVKCPGQSCLELRNNVYCFGAGDTSNPLIRSIHEKLESLETAMGMASRQHHRPGNAKSLYHSEKLALAFGLLNAPPTVPIRIIKNLRTCEDCHSFMELSSQIVNREIIMRDGNRFHIFKQGACSCRGYW